jgi:hypothetical protein
MHLLAMHRFPLFQLRLAGARVPVKVQRVLYVRYVTGLPEGSADDPQRARHRVKGDAFMLAHVLSVHLQRYRPG